MIFLLENVKGPSYSVVFFSQFSLFSKYTGFFLLVNSRLSDSKGRKREGKRVEKEGGKH
jgi:hypothetical protein